MTGFISIIYLTIYLFTLLEMNNNQDVFVEVSKVFFPKSWDSVVFYEIKGGVNNWSKGCTGPEGEFVVRVYNNGKNLPRVKLEHEVLLQLQTMYKTFNTPQLRRIPGTNQTIAILQQGFPCCVAKKIQGSLPKSFTREGLENFGYSVSQLTHLLARITLSQPPLIKPYHDLYAVHPSITKQNFHNQVSSLQYESVRPQVQKLLHYIQLTQSYIQQYHEINLPTQLIHGDVHNDNILMKENKVSAILDFEFIAEDWRAMEFAISLSKFVNMENALQITRDFNKGYIQAGALTQQELMAVPWLIILRLVSNFVYFVGRVIAKEESIEFCKQKIQLYCERIQKLLPKIEDFQHALVQSTQ